MSDDFVIDPKDFEGLQSEEVQNVETGDSDESTRGKAMFGRYRYFHIPVEWAKGDAGFPLPGVFNDKFDTTLQKSIRQDGPYRVKGAKPSPGSKKYMNVLVIEGQDKDGNSYQRVEQFASFDETWREYQWPAIRQLPDADRKSLEQTGIKALALFSAGKGWQDINQDSGTWVFAKTTLQKSPLTRTGGDGQERNTYYRNEFEVFANEDAFKVARDAFYTPKNGTGSEDNQDLPAEWVANGGTRQQLFDDIRERHEKGQAFKLIVNKCDLSGQTVAGSEVDAKSLVAKALDVPQDALEAYFNA